MSQYHDNPKSQVGTPRRGCTHDWLDKTDGLQQCVLCLNLRSTPEPMAQEPTDYKKESAKWDVR